MCYLGINISVITSEMCFKKLWDRNEFKCHTAPSSRLFIQNSLTVYHLSFLPRAVFATSVISLTFLPVACFFFFFPFFLQCSLFHRYHCSLLKCNHPKWHPDNVTVNQAAQTSTSFCLSRVVGAATLPAPLIPNM